jgi:hypothetical protein
MAEVDDDPVLSVLVVDHLRWRQVAARRAVDPHAGPDEPDTRLGDRRLTPFTPRRHTHVEIVGLERERNMRGAETSAKKYLRITREVIDPVSRGAHSAMYQSTEREGT